MAVKRTHVPLIVGSIISVWESVRAIGEAMLKNAVASVQLSVKSSNELRHMRRYCNKTCRDQFFDHCAFLVDHRKPKTVEPPAIGARNTIIKTTLIRLYVGIIMRCVNQDRPFRHCKATCLNLLDSHQIDFTLFTSPLRSIDCGFRNLSSRLIMLASLALWSQEAFLEISKV